MSECIMDVEEILSLLPHRYPFLLVDRVIAFEHSQSLVAVKNVTVNEDFFNGHFPQKRVMPGVLMLEALAQAGAVLAYKSTNSSHHEGVMFYLAGIDHARFKRLVVPGDQLMLEVTLIKSRSKVMRIAGKATVEGELACSAEITCFRGVEGK